MMWDLVMERIRTEILADPILIGIYGSAYRAAGTGEQIVPSLEWTLIGDTETELWAPMIVQFDQWTKTANQNRQSELRLRGLYHCNIPRRINNDLTMWSEYTDGSILPIPDRSGIYGRAIRFRFAPLRAQYARRIAL